MIKSVNRNYFWSQVILNSLVSAGVSGACISPGSRSTSLTLAAAEKKELKKYVIVDERSSAFFALGLAKASGKPAIIITTSGTATAELYPAVIEAFQRRVPMIVCTADRPSRLVGTGANQTINQANLYANHIRYYEDAGLPDISEAGLSRFVEILEKAYKTAVYNNPGPVHINLPFDKPFEPGSVNDKIDDKIYNKYINYTFSECKEPDIKDPVLPIKVKPEKLLIFSGEDNYEKAEAEKLLSFCLKKKIPVLADGTSAFRYIGAKNNPVCVCHNLYTESIPEPDLLIQTGSPPTSEKMLRYLASVKCEKIAVNPYGDIKDPSFTFKGTVRLKYSDLLKGLEQLYGGSENEAIFYEKIISLEGEAESVKNEYIKKADFPFEGELPSEVLNSLPEGRSVMVSNSIAVRDLDYFGGRPLKKLKLYFNRGASGIDGINSTAAGISAVNGRTILITGDLAFYHDIGSLHNIFKMKLPVTVILMNNNGGGIFNMLPVREEPFFEEYFKTPLDINFENIVKAFGGEYRRINDKEELINEIKDSLNREYLTVLEIRTDTYASQEYRRGIFKQAETKLKEHALR